jgi:acyl transferase domain-containing protein
MHDVSHTLFNGRTHHHLRAAFSGHSKKEIIWKLKDFKSDEAMAKAGKNGIAFVFPGQGVQHLGMMKDLYQAEPVFRTHLDICSDLLIPHLEHDIRNMIFNSHEQEHAASLLEQTRYAQPVLFSFEFSLAKLMESIGITADAYIGHSLGEYVAATLSGVFTLPDALAVIATRGKLMQATEAGVMYAIAAPLDSVRHVAQRHDISIAAVNSQNQTVISGAQAQVESAVKEMAAQGLRCKPIHRTHAFHSALMEPILAEFVQQLSKFTLSAPTTPIVSNVTGQWLGQEASDPAYWARHLRSAVLFKDGVETLQERSNVLIEVGPGQTLTSLIRGSGPESLRSVALCRHAKDDADDQLHLFSAIGELWAHGLNLDWQALYPNQPASKVALPSYPFQRKHYWVEALDRQNRAVQAAKELAAAPTAETANFQEPEPLDVYHWVKDAWTQLLGEADIDADSDFFALGGDSMVLVQLQRKINKHYGIKIELGTLYQLATLGELTLHLSSQPIRTCSIAQQ